MWFPLLALIASILILAQSAEGFTEGLVNLAKLWQLPKLWVGLVLMGFATSAPELLVVGSAAWRGQADLAIGSIIGSNIANVGLVLGLCATLGPIRVPQGAIRRELRVLMLSTALVSTLLYGLSTITANAAGSAHALSMPLWAGVTPQYWAGILLLLMLIANLWFLCRHHTPEPRTLPNTTQRPSWLLRLLQVISKPCWRYACLSLLSLAALLAGAELLVWSATRLATLAGASENLIGLTMVAMGTSLPELAASMASLRHGEGGMIFGNVLGSNLFNLLAALPVALLLAPSTIPTSMIKRDIPCMLLATTTLYMVSRPFGARPACVHRWEGALLLAGYGAYLFWLWLAQG